MGRYADHWAARLSRLLGAVSLALLVALGATPPAHAIDASRMGLQQMPIRNVVAPPPGASGLCKSFDWACARSGKTRVLDAQSMDLLRQVNAKANRLIRPITDMAQYRLEERWALPTRRGGDCEDYALFKKRELIRAGFAPEQLLIAVVLDRQQRFHAVLVVKTGKQDIVLDNMTNRIVPWQRTGYTFLRVQDPRLPSRWVSVFAGGKLPLS